MKKKAIICLSVIVAATFFSFAWNFEPGEAGTPATGIIHFAGATDQHYGWRDRPIPDGDQATIEDWMHHPDLPEFDFVVNSFGDWISDSRATVWQDLPYTFDVLTRLSADKQKIPYFFVVGNHDLSNFQNMPANNNPSYKEQLIRSIAGLNENNYAFMYNNVLFIGLGQTNVLYTLSGFQKSWVEHLLDRYQDHTTVIWVHQAIYRTTGQGDERSTTWSTNDYRVFNDLEWWRDLFLVNPQIKLFAHGHNEQAHNTTYFDQSAAPWDDNCAFVLVPSNGRLYGQDAWSYIFKIADDEISVQMWDSMANDYVTDATIGVPFVLSGSFNVLDTGMEWYSIPKRVLDGQTWTWKNRMVAKDYKLELVESFTTEQIDNPDLSGCHEGDEVESGKHEEFWYAVRGDEDVALNKDTGARDGFIELPGGNLLALAFNASKLDTVGGKVPYNTAIAVPGKTYRFQARIKTTGGQGNVDFIIRIPRRYTYNEFVWFAELIHEDFVANEQYQNFSQTFTVPDDATAWFIIPIIDFNDPAVTYIWDSWSLKMVPEGRFTEDFRVSLNGESLEVPDYGRPIAYMDLPTNEIDVPDPDFKPKYRSFDLSRTTMENNLNFSCSIGGNKVGMIRLIYERPQLWSDDVSIGIQNDAQTVIRLEDVSPFNALTSVMSFKGAASILSGNGFFEYLIRGKRSYFNSINDDGISGFYTLRKEGLDYLDDSPPIQRDF